MTSGLSEGKYISLEDNTMSSDRFHTSQTITAGGFVGDLTGNVTGNVTGDVTGDVTGHVVATTETVTTNSTGVAIAADSDFVTLTASSADNIAILPAPVVGKVVKGMIAGTGCEIRSSRPTGIAINGTTGAGVESALGANSSFEATCLGATKWRLSVYSSTGIETSPIPD